MQTLRLVRVGRICEDAPRYTSSLTVYDGFRNMMKLDREHFVVLHVDGKNRIIAKETISIGSLNQTIIHPREVFKAAVHNNSAGLILLHNHPTGDPTPSREDREITRRLEEAGEIIGIRVIDHIIIGSSSYYSMTDKGLTRVPKDYEEWMRKFEEAKQPVKAKARKKTTTRQRQAATA